MHENTIHSIIHVMLSLVFDISRFLVFFSRMGYLNFVAIKCIACLESMAFEIGVFMSQNILDKKNVSGIFDVPFSFF